MPKTEEKQRRVKGSGGISQRKDGTWQGQFDAGTKTGGKRDVRYVYAKTEQECKRKLKELIKEIHSTEYIRIQKTSVKNYMENWLTSVKKNELKPKSYDRLEQTLQYDVYPKIGHIQLQSIKPSDVQNMINALRDEGKSYSTIKKAYDAVNACFKLGVIQKTVALNPVVGVSVPSKKLFKQKDIPFYTEQESKQLIEQALSVWGNGVRRYPLGSFVPLLINTGLRMSELLSLQWNRDIDLKNKTLTVHTNTVFVRDREKDSGYKLIEQDTVKTDAGQDRTIPLNTVAYNSLLDLQKLTGNELYVMTTSAKTQVKPRQLDQMFRRIATAAQLPEDKIYGVHALRHTFATLLLSKDIDIKTVSVLLGHSDVTVTYNTYIHVIKEQKAKALDMIPDLTQT